MMNTLRGVRQVFRYKDSDMSAEALRRFARAPASPGEPVPPPPGALELALRALRGNELAVRALTLSPSLLPPMSGSAGTPHGPWRHAACQPCINAALVLPAVRARPPPSCVGSVGASPALRDTVFAGARTWAAHHSRPRRPREAYVLQRALCIAAPPACFPSRRRPRRRLKRGAGARQVLVLKAAFAVLAIASAVSVTRRRSRAPRAAEVAAAAAAHARAGAAAPADALPAKQ